MGVHQVETEIAKLIADTSTINAQSQWIRFAMGAVALCAVAVISKLIL